MTSIIMRELIGQYTYGRLKEGVLEGMKRGMKKEGLNERKKND